MMKQTWKKMMTVGAITLMGGATLAGCANAGAAKKGNNPGKTIKIGVNMELSGAAAAYGNAQKQGIELAAEQINKAGGIKVGNTKKKVQIIYRDNKTSTTSSTSVTSQLVNNDKVVAIVGPATTNDGTAAIPNATKAQVPQVSPSATDPNFTMTKGGKVQPYVFRACYQNDIQGKSAATFSYKTLKAKKVAVLADKSSDYGTGLEKAFVKNYQGKVASTQYFEEGDKDFNAMITKIKSQHVDAIYAPGYYSEVGLIIKQARQQGVKAPVIGSDGMADPKLAKIAGNNNASHIYYTTPFSVKGAGKNAASAQFMKDFQAKFHSQAPTFSALAYDSVNMVKAAIENEKSANSVKITVGLAKLKDFKAVTGTTTIDKQHNPQKPISIEQLTNGQVSKVYSIK